MENPQETSRNASKRVLWAVLLVLVLAVAGYGVYAYLADQDNDNANNQNVTNTGVGQNVNSITITNADISGWKVYRDSEHGFSFRYPSNLGTPADYTSTTSFNGKLIKRAGVSAAGANPFIHVYIVDDSTNNVKSYLEETEFTPAGKNAVWDKESLNGDQIEFTSLDYSSDNTYFLNIRIIEQNDIVLVVETYNSASEEDTAFQGFSLID